MVLSPYDVGRTPFFTLQADRRFSYCLAVQLDVVPGAGHTGKSMFPAVQAFMSRVLKGNWPY